MTNLTHPARHLLDNLDGFRIEIDEAQQRADIVLDRPPLNVVSMPQRDQLRCAFEALDAPVRRVAGAFTPIPFADPLERAVLPDDTDIAAAIRDLASF